MLAAVAWAGGIACAALILAGNAVSRATAFAAMDEDFQLNLDTRDLFEAAGFLLFVSGALAAILLVVGVSLATLRHGVLPRWLGWAGFVVAALSHSQSGSSASSSSCSGYSPSAPPLPSGVPAAAPAPAT